MKIAFSVATIGAAFMMSAPVQAAPCGGPGLPACETEATPVPAPPMLILFGMAAAGLVLARRRKES